MSRMVRAALVLLLALLISGCAGSDRSSGTPGDRSRATATPDDEAIDAAATEPGTSLDLGEEASVSWKPAADLTGVVDVSVDAVAEQPRSLFEGWLGAEDLEDARPYFVNVTVTNAGDSDLAAQRLPLYLRDDNDAVGSPWTVGAEFDACQSGPLPEPFGPGAETELCLVYLVADDGRAVDVIFWPSGDVEPVSWSGRVTEPGRKAGSRRRR